MCLLCIIKIQFFYLSDIYRYNFYTLDSYKMLNATNQTNKIKRGHSFVCPRKVTFVQRYFISEVLKITLSIDRPENYNRETHIIYPVAMPTRTDYRVYAVPLIHFLSNDVLILHVIFPKRLGKLYFDGN